MVSLVSAVTPPITNTDLTDTERVGVLGKNALRLFPTPWAGYNDSSASARAARRSASIGGLLST